MNSFFQIYFLLFFLITNVISKAQNLNLIFSDNVTTSLEYKPQSCFIYKDYYLLIQQKTKSSNCDLKLNLFDNQLHGLNQFDVTISNHSFLSIQLFFGKILLFTSKNENNETKLYAHEFDVNNGFSKSSEIYSEPNLNGYSSGFIVSDTTYEGQFYVLTELPYQSKKNEDLKLLTFNNSLKLVKEVYNKLDFPFESKRDNRLLVSSLGNIILIKRLKGNNFNIYKMGNEVINEVEIKLNNRKIAALDYFFNKKNELVIAGFFSSQNRYNYSGYFIHNYDEDLTLVHKNQYFLNKKVVETFKSSNEIKETGFGLDKFRLSDFSIDGNGNYFLMAEHLGRKKIKDINQWNSKGMVVIKFNKNGNFVWACPIVFKQTNPKIRFIGSFHLNSFKKAEYFYNSLSNLKLRKGIPSEYGANNFCGTKGMSFTSVGIQEEKIVKMDFPTNNSNSYAIYPKQLNPYKTGGSIFSIIDGKGENLMIGFSK